jgi:hypothetical protein
MKKPLGGLRPWAQPQSRGQFTIKLRPREEP